MKLLIKQAGIISPGSSFNGQTKDILVIDGVIAAIGNSIDEKADKVISIKGLSLSTGWLDIFAHFGDPGFESRFIRRWRVEKRARAVSYWMPAIAGAVVASVALLAVLQILFSSPARDDADLKNREASRGPAIPAYGESSPIDPDR